VENPDYLGESMHQLMRRLFPICRSITGDGATETLSIVDEIIPLEISKISTGTEVLDWTIPQEWNITDAYIANMNGERIIDFNDSNVHVVNYSTPVRKRISLHDLRKHLHTLPDLPDAIPYLTSYYNRDWGFSLTQRQYDALQNEEYDVVIESSIEDGNLTYGEYFIPGKSSEEILISTYICHPSTCNDNLSGVVLATYLAKHLSTRSLNYSYRFLFVPETIGAIAWLAQNESSIDRIKCGFVVTCVGDPGSSTYQRTRNGETELDAAVINVLQSSGTEFSVRDFIPWGSDERQYSSPGYNIPIGLLMRTPYGKFPEYHTSLDNLDFVQPAPLADSLAKHISAIYVLENNGNYLNTNPKGEPQFSKRSLHRTIGGQKIDADSSLAMYWILNFSDGAHSLIAISDKSKIRFDIIKSAADILVQNNLLEEMV
jgi:aminopeptidase-like protein